jgi:ketosteroid isomerase-like protein
VTPTDSTTGDEIVIRDLIESWARAVRGKDLDGILAHHSPEILMFDLPPPIQAVGIEAYKKSWDLFFNWSKDPGVFDIVELNVTAGQVSPSRRRSCAARGPRRRERRSTSTFGSQSVFARSAGAGR